MPWARIRLVDAAYAAANFPLPVVTVDLGTATTFNVVDENRVFRGGVICPGLSTGLRALGDRCAQLPQVHLGSPRSAIGTNTEKCMLSGSVMGTAVLIDGMVQRIEEELGRPATLVVTGGLAKYVTPLCRHALTYDPELLMKGLALLYQLNASAAAAPQCGRRQALWPSRTSTATRNSAPTAKSAPAASRKRWQADAGRQDGEKNQMKLGILGTGKIVREFLPWLAEHTPFAVQAICSTERSAELAQSLCGQYGVPQHTTNFLELLQWVDVVYIAVPNLQHVRYARVALEAGKHVIVEKPLAPSAAQTEELVELARHKKVFLFEAVTTQYLENYAKIRELLPRIGTVKLVQCNFSQYSSRYDAFCAGDVQPAFDPACAGGALMDLGVYNVSYIVGLFGEPNQVKYTANMERGIDTSGILTMDYSGFKAVSIAAKDCAAPARYIIQGTKGYILQKSTANCCGGVTFHPNEGKEEHYNLNGGRPRQAAEFEAFARALENGDQELCTRMQDTTIAVSRVMTVARRSAGIRFPCDR